METATLWCWQRSRLDGLGSNMEICISRSQSAETSSRDPRAQPGLLWLIRRHQQSSSGLNLTLGNISASPLLRNGPNQASVMLEKVEVLDKAFNLHTLLTLAVLMQLLDYQSS